MDNNLRLYFCEATQIIIPDANCSEPHAAHFSSISHCFQHVWEPWIIANTTLSTTYNCISVRVALISPWFPNGTTIVFSIHALIYMWYLQWNPLSYLDHCTGTTLHIFFFFWYCSNSERRAAVINMSVAFIFSNIQEMKHTYCKVFMDTGCNEGRAYMQCWCYCIEWATNVSFLVRPLLSMKNSVAGTTVRFANRIRTFITAKKSFSVLEHINTDYKGASFLFAPVIPWFYWWVCID